MLKYFFLLLNLIIAIKSQTNKCPQFEPYCNCYASPLVLTCDNFTSFSQLDFGTSETKINEIELAPLKPTIFDGLNLGGLEISSQVSLRNIDKFVLTSNPFELARKNNTLRLNMNNLTLKFDINENCSLSAIDSNFKPLFASFNLIYFGDDIDYTNQLCPLVFLNANARRVEMVNIIGSNRFIFKKLEKPDFIDNPLKNNIEELKIYDANSLVIDDEFLDEDVFFNTKTIDVDNSNLKRIANDAFLKLYYLKKLTLNLENMQEFLNSSENKWMLSLNSDILVDLDDDEKLKENINETFVLILNNRIKEQNYLYMDEDLKYFTHFPHEKVI